MTYSDVHGPQRHPGPSLCDQSSTYNRYGVNGMTKAVTIASEYPRCLTGTTSASLNIGQFITCPHLHHETVDLPSQPRQLPHRSPNPRNRHPSERLGERLRSPHEQTPQTDTKSPKKRNIPLPEEILQVAGVGARCGDGENVGCGEPG